MMFILAEWLNLWAPWFVGLTTYFILADIVFTAFRRGR